MTTFDMIDKDEDGLITAAEFQATMKGIGQDATEEEVVAMIQTVSGGETINFEQFLKIMMNESPNADTEDDIVSAFRALDPQDTGKCNVHELTFCLKHLTKCLTDAEVGALIQESDADANNMMDYKAFARKLFAPL